MQETRPIACPDLSDESLRREFFKGESDAQIVDKMNDRLMDLETASQPEQLVRRRKIGRNEPCPCGSGRKFKKCCLTSAR